MLRKLLKTVSVTALIATQCFSLSADETPAVNTNFSNIYYFGDSLTDGRDKVNGGIYPNGEVWAKTLSQINSFPYNITLNNFAREGSQTATTAGKPGIIGPTNQIDNFNTTIGTIAQNDLFAFWIGHNDIMTATPTSAGLSAAAIGAIDNLIIAINGLITNGAQNFLILNLANFADTPAFSVDSADVRRAFTVFAQSYLKQKITTINPSANLIVFDFLKLQDEVIANPGAFIAGATTGNDFFLTAAQDSIINVHPSIEAQALIGTWVSDLLAAPLPFIILPDYTIATMDRNTQNIFGRQNFLKHHCHDQSGFRFYVEGNMGEYELKKSASPFRADSETGGLALGMEIQAKGKSTLGLKISYDHNDLKFKSTTQTLKKAEIKEAILSLYGFLFLGENLNLAANISYGSIGIDTTRVQTTGVSSRREPGSGTGQHYSAAAQIGYDLNFINHMILTPYISAAYHYVNLDEIQEKNLTSISLAYKLPSENAQFYRIGTEILGQFEAGNMHIDPFINVAAVYENRSRDNKLQARSARIDRFFTLTSSKVMKNDTYAEIDVGINLGLTCKDTITAKYGGKFFSDKQKHRYGTISYTRAL